jgi:hypothetical protein
VFSVAIDGAVYAKHGTTIDTRLTVIDKRPAVERCKFPASPGMAPDAATLLDWVLRDVPARLPIVGADVAPAVSRNVMPRTLRGSTVRRSSLPAVAVAAESIELTYETLDWRPIEGARITDALYEEYGLQTIRIPDSQAHPTKLVQSVAMASVAPPKPSYGPHLPPAVISGGFLSRHLCRRGPFRPSGRIVEGR